MIRAPAVVIGFAIFAIGCQPLPAGRVAAIQDGGRTRRLCNVYLIRGWQDLWSQGVDELAVQLRGKGFRAEVFRAAQWREVAGALAKASKDQSLVLIGFSYGADDVIEIARQLRDGGRSVDLLITIDPVTPPPVPAN